MHILAHVLNGKYTVLSNEGLICHGVDYDIAFDILAEQFPDNVTTVAEILDTVPDPAKWRSLFAECTNQTLLKLQDDLEQESNDTAETKQRLDEAIELQKDLQEQINAINTRERNREFESKIIQRLNEKIRVMATLDQTSFENAMADYRDILLPIARREIRLEYY